MRGECVIVAAFDPLNDTEIKALRAGMIFVTVKEVTLGPGVAKRSGWDFASFSKRPLRLLLRKLVCRDSNASFNETQPRLPQPVDSYAH